MSAAPTSDTILYDKFRVSSRADKLARFNLLFNSGTRVIHELHRAYYQKTIQRIIKRKERKNDLVPKTTQSIYTSDMLVLIPH